MKWALTATLLQGIFGTLNFVSLPAGSYSTVLLIHIGAALALIALVCMVLIRALQKTSGASIVTAVVLLGVIALLMSTIRHIVRENLLREPQKVAERRTQEYRASLASFLQTHTPEGSVTLTGEELFKRYCTGCHTRGSTLVGPPVEYMTQKYGGKPEQMTEFVLNPTKVNPELPNMPKPPIDREEAEKIVGYILSGSQ